ncbi:MAG TPA: XRE family transcriptional regulator [Sediminispirochaeta sp.]|nr:XRE family transcriptional regulator [Sediminispirochaeta sp.]
MDTKKLGSNIRKFREEAGLSQQQLAERLGVSFQQLQKYEYGQTRLTVDRLMDISRLLHVPLLQFIPHEEIEETYGISAETETYAPFERVIVSPDEVKLIKYFRSLKNEKLRTTVLRQIKEWAEVYWDLESDFSSKNSEQ